MFSSILFLISVIFLTISFLLLKKSDIKLNIIKWIFISLVLLFCFNSLISYILSYLKIPTTLLSLSIIYLLISLIIYIKFLKKERQRYYYNKKDLIHLIILFIIVLIVSFIRFGFPFSIRYNTIDPAVHFRSSYSFYKESFLLNFVQDKTLVNFVTWRFASYTNLGLIFKFLVPIVAENDFYNIYIIFDIFTLFMTSVLFYYLINNENKGIIKLIGAILFLLGYPLNNLLIGFFYVGHASCIIITIMLIIREFKYENMFFPSLYILNIGLTFTYYLFIPFVFLAEFLYFIKTKKVIRKFFWLFIFPLVLGFLYFILPTFSNTNMNLINQTKLDGYFYNDVFGNSLLFFPIISYYLYNKIKNKKIDFELIILISFSVIMIALNVCMLMHIIMTYYVSKYYYILWIICFVILFRVYDDYYEQNKIIFKNYALFMVITIVLSITNIEKQIIELNQEWNRTTPSMLFNVYNYNLYLYENPNTVFTSKEINDIKQLSKTLDISFFTNTEPERILWLINFIQDGKLDCPVNQFYDCIKEFYTKDINEYAIEYKKNYSVKKPYIYFYRSLYWTGDYNSETISSINNLINSNSFKVEYFENGFIIRE